MNAIETLAATHDAAILHDRQSDIALFARQYDDEGRQVLRPQPDRCDFHSPEKWESMTPEQAAAAVC